MLVSVIIPVYNVKDYLEECVMSVFNQTYKRLEVILVNNNSTDGSAEVMQKISGKFTETILMAEEKQSASAARNKGLSVAKGEYIQFLDADDLLMPEKIEYQLKHFVNESFAPDIIHGNYLKRKADGTEQKVTMWNQEPWLGLMKTRLGCTCSNLWKRTALAAVNGWNEELKSSQEYDLMFRMMKGGATSIVDESFNTIVRERSNGNISSTNLSANWKTYCDLRIRIIEHCSTRMNEIPKTYIQVLFDAIRMLYVHDSKTAIDLWEKHIPKKFIPDATEVTSASYVRTYKLLGFKRAEQLRKLIKK